MDKSVQGSTIIGIMLLKKNISFIFPHPVNGPTGGYKVVYEYANRLVADGHKVNIVYSGSLFWKKKSLYYKLTNCVRYIQHILKGYSGRRWFALDKRAKEHLTLSLNYCHVPKSDIYICTSPYTAMYVKDYPTDKKYYFIQGYENWGGLTDEKLRETYHYPLKKIVISDWLAKIMQEEGCSYTVIKNGFDFEYFKQSIGIEDRERYSIAMMYSNNALKGCEYGLEALRIVKGQYPNAKIRMFGLCERPTGLADEYEYNQAPDKNTLNRIYNESAIFIGTSNSEGWGLTIGEAMICGAAVVCTDNAGYREMAKDGENALISPVKNAEALARNIIKLFENDTLRQQIAKNGNEFIKQFSWDNSYKKLVETLGIQ